ncbi:unnamed protein product, partial [Hapterophycus canaliculatus]
EQHPFVVRGRPADYFAGWLETADMEAFVSGQSMQYGTDLDVTNYVNKRRVTLNPPAASRAKFVWQKFREGCSLRMPCPQKYSD